MLERLLLLILLLLEEEEEEQKRTCVIHQEHLTYHVEVYKQQGDQMQLNHLHNFRITPFEYINNHPQSKPHNNVQYNLFAQNLHLIALLMHEPNIYISIVIKKN